MNPQRKLFKEYYCNPDSETFGNAQQSALKAGFGKKYSTNILNHGQEWVLEIIRDSEMIGKAESNLKEAMEIPISDKELGDRSLKATMFVAERLGKKKWSNRTELTGPEGKDLPQPILCSSEPQQQPK